MHTHRFVQHSLDFLLFFSPIPMGFVPCDARVLTVLPDSTLDLFKRSLFTITKETIFLKKADHQKERPLFTAHFSGEIRHYGYFEISQTPGSYFIYFIFFYRKEKAKLCFLQQDFLIYIYIKKLEHELEESKLQKSPNFNVII